MPDYVMHERTGGRWCLLDSGEFLNGLWIARHPGASGNNGALMSPIGHVWKAPGKNFLTFRSIGRVRSTVRPSIPGALSALRAGYRHSLTVDRRCRKAPANCSQPRTQVGRGLQVCREQ